MTPETNNYWDYVSVQEQQEGEESIKDLLKEAYDFASPFLNNLISYECDMVFMNLVNDVPQTTIAEVFGMSQLGVSKRVRGGISKLKTVMSVPETDKALVRDTLKFLLPSEYATCLTLYYHYKTFSLVADLMQDSSSNVRNWVFNSLDLLQDISKVTSRKDFMQKIISYKGNDYENDYSEFERLQKLDWETYVYQAERYHKYLANITAQANYGDYLFKADGTPRNGVKTYAEWIHN